MKVYVGYDVRDELAFRACVSSLLAHASIPLQIIPIKEFDLRRRNIFHRGYTVKPSGQMIDSIDKRPFSTTFTFTRFAIPLIDNSDECVLFCDADFLWRADVALLFALFDKDKSLMCVQHDYKPKEKTKFDGMLQEQYLRKNWSSLMLFNPSKCKITQAELNGASGRYLHQLKWLADEQIGALPAAWNWLEGWSDESVDPLAVHYTRGTPDMLGDFLPYSAEWRVAVAQWQPQMNLHVIP